MNIEIKDSAVFRDGEQIGTINDGTCLSPSAIAGRVKGAINEAHGSKLTFIVAPVSAKAMIDAETKDREEQAIEASPLFGIERLAALVEAGKIPPHPKTRPDMGDKTPEYVEWFRTYATPDEFETKYSRRTLPQSIAQVDAELARKEAAKKGDAKFSV